MDLHRSIITLDWEEENEFTRNIKKGCMTISDPYSQRHIEVKLTATPKEEQIQIDGVKLIRLYPNQEGLHVDTVELRVFVEKYIKDTLNPPKKDD